MGTIYEMWGNVEEALKFYHKSLECVAEWRETVRKNTNIELGVGFHYCVLFSAFLMCGDSTG